ncbi:MAG: hypothetical protein ACRELC_09820, partial [Gemmatimonadota bacterium]
MDRRSSRDRHRMRLGVGILASVACHAVLFALVTFDLDPIAGPETIRRTAHAPASVDWNAWTERPLQVVRIRSTSHASNTESGAATERATPTAPVQAPDVGASPVGAPVAAMPPAALDPGGAHGAPAIDVAFVASTPGGS